MIWGYVGLTIVTALSIDLIIEAIRHTTKQYHVYFECGDKEIVPISEYEDSPYAVALK